MSDAGTTTTMVSQPIKQLVAVTIVTREPNTCVHHQFVARTRVPVAATMTSMNLCMLCSSEARLIQLCTFLSRVDVKILRFKQVEHTEMVPLF